MENKKKEDILDPHFQFKCFQCQIEFPVYFKYLKTRDSLECPNCKQVFPKNSFEKIQNSISNLELAVQDLVSSNKYDLGWNFYIQWNNSLGLPERPGKYDHLVKTFGIDYDPFN